MNKRAIWLLAIALGSFSLVAWQLHKSAQMPALALKAAKSWHYQLQSIDPDLIAQSSADLLVIDYSRNGRDEAALKYDEVNLLKQRPGGGSRAVVAYLSVGEAEEYRYYWRPEWKRSSPGWLFSENCRWPGNHLVRYWYDEWKDIIYRRSDSYLNRIIAAGFDGVYLDRIDAYWDLHKRYPEAQAEARRLVKELANRARALKPGFLVIAQNAESLLADAEYRAAIDGIAKEDLLYGVSGTGIRNDAKLIEWSINQLKLLAANGKPIPTVEYLSDADSIAKASHELASLGFISTFPARALDGRSPLSNPPATVAAKSETATGTPEFGAKHCHSQ